MDLKQQGGAVADSLKDTVGTLLEALLRLSHKPDALKDLGAAAKKV